MTAFATQEPSAAFDPWRDRTLPYIQKHCTSKVDHELSTEQSSLEILLAVTPADLDAYPDIHRLVQIDAYDKLLGQINKALQVPATSPIPSNPSNSTASQPQDVFTMALRGVAQKNHLRLTRENAGYLRDSIRKIDSCIRLGSKPSDTGASARSLPGRGEDVFSERNTGSLLSREAIRQTPFQITDHPGGDNRLMPVQVVPVPAGLAVDEPAPTRFELKSLSSYKYHMTRDQAKTCETYIKKSLLSLGSSSKMSLQERLAEVGRSVIDEEVKPLSLPLISRRSYQQQKHPARPTTDLKSIALEIYQPISVQAEEASFKLDEERIIAPLESVLTPKKPVKTYKVERVDTAKDESCPSSDFDYTDHLYSDAFSEVSECLQVAKSEPSGSSPAQEHFEKIDLPIVRRPVTPEKVVLPTLPLMVSPVSLPSEFSVDLISRADYKEDEITKFDADNVSLAVQDDRPLLQGLSEKASIVLARANFEVKAPPTEKLSMPNHDAMFARLSIINPKTSFKIDRTPRQLKDIVEAHEATAPDIFKSPMQRDMAIDLEWSPFHEIPLRPDAKELLASIDQVKWEDSEIIEQGKDQTQGSYAIEPTVIPVDQHPPILKRADFYDKMRSAGPQLASQVPDPQPSPRATKKRRIAISQPAPRSLHDPILNLAMIHKGKTSSSTGLVELPDDMFMFSHPIAEPTLIPEKLESRFKSSLHQNGGTVPNIPVNNEYWRSALSDIESRRSSLEPLTCLTALTVLTERTLCHGLSRVHIDLVDTADLEADLVVSPRTAIVFQQVGALASDGASLGSYLGGLSHRYQRVVVVIILHPRKRDSDDLGMYVDPWSEASLKAYQRLQGTVSRRKAAQVAACETAAEIDTIFEYVFSEHAEMTGLIVRVCAERDEKEYAKETSREFARAMFADREYLRWDHDLLRADLVTIHHLNSHTASLIGAYWTTEKILRANQQELVEAFGSVVTAAVLLRLWKSLHPIVDLTTIPSPVQNEVSPIKPGHGNAKPEQVDNYASHNPRATSPYASFVGTLIRPSSFADDFEDGILPDTPERYYHPSSLRR